MRSLTCNSSVQIRPLQFRALVKRYGTRPERDLPNHIGYALSSKANLLMRSENTTQAVVVYTELLQRVRIGSHTEEKIIANAMFNRATLLCELGKQMEAVEQYGELLHRFDRVTEA